jgi:hypothetical protein
MLKKNIINKLKNSWFVKPRERKRINLLAKEFGFKQIHTEKKAFTGAWNQIIKEMKSKEHLDFVDFDRILGKHGFSFTDKEVYTLVKVINATGALKIIRTKGKNLDAYHSEEYIIKK